MLEEWIDEVCAALGIEDEIDSELLLDVARDVAHSVERRAAPVTTYLLGLAAASADNSSEGLNAAARTVTTLAQNRGAS